MLRALLKINAFKQQQFTLFNAHRLLKSHPVDISSKTNRNSTTTIRRRLWRALSSATFRRPVRPHTRIFAWVRLDDNIGRPLSLSFSFSESTVESITCKEQTICAHTDTGRWDHHIGVRYNSFFLMIDSFIFSVLLAIRRSYAFINSLIGGVNRILHTVGD